jgi:chain length determinant protein EpsF
MNLSQFLSILRARWWAALLVFLLTVITAIGITLLLPKVYTATATLVVDQMRPDPVSAATYSGNPSPAFMATQVDVLKSDRVARRVVSKLGLEEDTGSRESWTRQTKGVGNFNEWLVENLARELEVKPSRESNVISVAVKASDPVRAATLANAFVQAFLDVSLELKVDPAKQYSTFFESRSREARANVERAQAKLSAYQRDKGVIIASEGQLDGETARLNELSSQLIALQAVASESNSRQAMAQSGSSDRMQDVINNPNLAALRSDITRAEARLQELTSRLGDNHPQVIEAKANISSLRGRLDAETRRVTGSFGVSSTINRQREVEIRVALEAQRARVLRMRTAREEGGVLVRDLESAQRAYEAVQSRLSQTSLESQTTQSNGYVLTDAGPPLLPSSPKVILNGLASIALGLALGLAAVVLLEFADRRVRTVDEISELLGLPIFGVLPRPGGIARFSGGQKLLISPRGLFARLPAPSKEA